MTKIQWILLLVFLLAAGAASGSGKRRSLAFERLCEASSLLGQRRGEEPEEAAGTLSGGLASDDALASRDGGRPDGYGKNEGA